MAKNKSGFDAPAIGKTVPKGYIMKRNKDGTIKFVAPKKGK